MSVDLGSARIRVDADTGQAEQKLSSFGDTIKKIGIGAAVAAAVKSAVDGIKSVVEAFGEYEQLVGGIETLFKDSSDKLMDYANNAYKTAGMSANQYMEVATSFSASLLQSLGGDTEAAVEYANMAITDMSDNANKMGTDVASIQNAYQGFAKQNYTMLDNLKLGYGGTKSEMERLIADANTLRSEQGITTKLSINNMSDIITAIHTVQTQMGITGTTAQEAEHTISGSINSLKGAWKNFVVGLGNSNADVKKLARNVVDSFKTCAKNVIPIIKNLAEALPDALTEMAEAATEIIADILPDLVKCIMNLIKGLVKALPKAIPVIIEAIISVVEAILEALPDILEAFMEAIPMVIDAILRAFPKLITAICKAIPEIITTIIEGLPKMLMEIGESIIENFPIIIEAVLKGLAGVFVGIIDWFAKLFTDVDEKMEEMGELLEEKAENFTSWGERLEELEPHIANWNSLVSSTGETVESLSKQISEKENAITEIYRTAFTEQGKLRQEDIQSIEKYLDDIAKLYEQKIELAGLAVEATTVGIQSYTGDMTNEWYAQQQVNLDEALSTQLQAVDEGYNNRLQLLLNKYTEMGQVGSDAYKKELDNLNAWRDGQYAIYEQNKKDATKLLLEKADTMMNTESHIWNVVNATTKQYSTDNKNDLEKWWANTSAYFHSTDYAVLEYQKTLANVDLETGNSYLNMAANAKAAGNEINQHTKDMISGMLDSFDTGVYTFDDAGRDMLLGLTKGLESQIPALKNATDMTNEEIVDTITSFFGIHSPSTKMRSFGENIMEGLIDGMNLKEGAIQDVLRKVLNSMTTPFDEMWHQGNEIGQDLGSGIAEGISSKSWSIKSIAEQVVNNAIAAARRAGDIHSPSKKMAWIGKMLDEGAAQGIKENQDKPIDAMTAMGNALNETFADIATAKTDYGAYMSAATNVYNKGLSGSTENYRTDNITINLSVGSVRSDDDIQAITYELEKLRRKNFRVGGIIA